MSQHIVYSVVYILYIHFTYTFFLYEKFSPRTRPTYLYVLRYEKPGRSRFSSLPVYPSSSPLYVYIILIRSLYLPPLLSLSILPSLLPLYIRSTYTFYVYILYIYDLRLRPSNTGSPLRGSRLGWKKRETR